MEELNALNVQDGFVINFEYMKPNDKLTSSEVIKMPLAEFEERFNFRPVSAIEKHYFAGLGRRPDATTLGILTAGILGEIDLTGVMME